MERIIYKKQENIKKVRINNSISTFLIIFSILFIIVLVIMFVSGVKIQPGPLNGLSQSTLYLIVIIMLLIVNLFFFSPKIEFMSDSIHLVLKKKLSLHYNQTFFFKK